MEVPLGTPDQTGNGGGTPLPETTPLDPQIAVLLKTVGHIVIVLVCVSRLL